MSSEMSVEDVSKMTVAELREELQKRDADSKGLKADLKNRLTELLNKTSESEAVPETTTEEPEPTDTTETTTENATENTESAEAPTEAEKEEPQAEEESSEAAATNEGAMKRTADEAGVEAAPEKKRPRTEGETNDETKQPQDAEQEKIGGWLKTLDQKSLLDLCISCLRFPDVQAHIRKSVASNTKLCKLFIRGLDYNTSEETLKKVFSDVGTVSECTIVKDKPTNRSKGYGFITMSNADEASEALKTLKREIDGRDTFINLASDRERQGGAHQQNRNSMGGRGRAPVAYGNQRSNWGQQPRYGGWGQQNYGTYYTGGWGRGYQ